MCSVTQHQCRRRQMCGKCSQIHQVHSHFVRTCPDWTNLFMANFQLTRMSSYAKNKLQMCSVTQHQCRRRQMCGKCWHINSLHSLLDCYKKDLSSLNNLFMAMFQLISMSSYAKNKLQMCSVTQHQCRRRQMCGKCSQIHPIHSLLSVTKNDLSWLNNLFMARFQLIRMTFYAKNKLQMVSVTQHQCRRRQMCRKCSQIHQVHSLFVRTCPDWTIYSWRTFNSLGCPLTLRTNYRCVQSLNISVDVAKCVENVHHINSLHSLLDCYGKKTCLHWTIYSWQSFNSLGCHLMLKINYRCVQSLNITRLAKCWVTEHICSLF